MSLKYKYSHGTYSHLTFTFIFHSNINILTALTHTSLLLLFFSLINLLCFYSPRLMLSIDAFLHPISSLFIGSGLAICKGRPFNEAYVNFT